MQKLYDFLYTLEADDILMYTSVRERIYIADTIANIRYKHLNNELHANINTLLKQLIQLNKIISKRQDRCAMLGCALYSTIGTFILCILILTSVNRAIASYLYFPFSVLIVMLVGVILSEYSFCKYVHLSSALHSYKRTLQQIEQAIKYKLS